MTVGYMLKVGDKTTCGGVVLTGDSIINIEGKPAATESSMVSCGKHSGQFKIIGGVNNIKTPSGKMAGTLDSFSSCPCKAKFIEFSCNQKYQKENMTDCIEKERGSNEPIYDEKIKVLDPAGDPIFDYPYFIIKDDEYLFGRTDRNGETNRIKTIKEHSLKVFWGDDALFMKGEYDA